MGTTDVSPRNRAERRLAGKKARAAGAVLTAGSAALAMGAAWVGPGVQEAHAVSTFTVTQATETGNPATVGSLSWAIAQANGDPGSTIEFDVPGGTISITSGPVEHITEPVTITGPGASALTIDGQHAHRIFYIDSNANTGAGVTISGLTLANGESDNADGDGGAILSGAMLTLSDSVISGSNAEGDGGALYFAAQGPLVLTNDTFVDNKANHFYGGDGGAVAVAAAGSVTITGSTFDNNTAEEAGGALYFGTTAAAVVITDSVFTGNTSGVDPDTGQGRAGGGGGAIFDYDQSSDHSLTIAGTTISGNTALAFGGGGVQMYSDLGEGTASISDSVVSGNSALYSGGGLYFYGAGDITITRTTVADNSASHGESGTGGGGIFLSSTSGTFRLDESTVSGNSAASGGGIWLYAQQTINVANSTISGNTATDGGGAITFYGPNSGMYLVQDTISGNHAAHDGGLYALDYQINSAAASKRAHVLDGKQRETGEKERSTAAQAHSAHAPRVHAQGAFDVTVTSTILSGNDNGDAGGKPFTLIASHDVLGTVAATVDDLGGNIASNDPGVGELADNGGPTQTMALRPGSLAIDAGLMPVPAFPGNEFDQRGAGFDRVVAGTVDIGAFEVQAPAPIDIQPRFTG